MSCLHENRKATRRIVGGNETVSLQCQRCGSGLAAKTKLYDLRSLPDFDPSIARRYSDAIQAEIQQRQEKFGAELAMRSREWWNKYNLYLHSPAWMAVRRAVLVRDQMCQKCFAKRSMQAHHISYATYNRFGFTFPVECVGVCLDCHDFIHSKERE